MMKLNSIRNDYKYAAISEGSLTENPMNLFEQWMDEALAAQINEPTAMSVSTVGNDGYPQSRIVLLKDYSDDGFTFFTNYESNKGKAIQNNPAVSLLIFWPEFERQIRITGNAKETSKDISDHYFHSRPLLSQAAAIVSKQSKKIDSRKDLEDRFNDLTKNLPEKNFERPENWGGYIVKPIKIEFWQGRENRLHDRILFEKINENWQVSRLAP